jgi:energy-coupling factor transporter ATP-binding protein EcfA2
MSLSGAFIAALVGVSESKKQSVKSHFAHTERVRELETLATQLTLEHEQKLNALYSEFGYDADDEYEGNYEDVEQPQITGATIHQTQIPGAESPLTWQFIEPSLITYPAVALIGPQGSGKTTIAQHLIRLKKSAGHEVVVLDPHYRKGEWAGCRVIGSGKDYEAIDAYLVEVAALVVQRYQERERHGTEEFSPITIVVEELTCWAGRVNAGEFIKSSMSDFRKIGITALFISHGETNSLWGDAKGTRGLRDSSLAFVRPQVRLTPQGARPAGKAMIAIPGFGSGVIDLPDLRQAPSMSPVASAPSPTTNTTTEETDRERLTRTLKTPPKLTPLQLKVFDFVVAQDGCRASVRQVQRGCGIPTSDEVRAVFNKLQNH